MKTFSRILQTALALGGMVLLLFVAGAQAGQGQKDQAPSQKAPATTTTPAVKIDPKKVSPEKVLPAPLQVAPQAGQGTTPSRDVELDRGLGGLPSPKMDEVKLPDQTIDPRIADRLKDADLARQLKEIQDALKGLREMQGLEEMDLKDQLRGHGPGGGSPHDRATDRALDGAGGRQGDARPSMNPRDWMSGAAGQDSSSTRGGWLDVGGGVRVYVQPTRDRPRVTSVEHSVGSNIRVTTTNRSDGGYTIQTYREYSDGSAMVRYQHYGKNGEHDPQTDVTTIDFPAPGDEPGEDNAKLPRDDAPGEADYIPGTRKPSFGISVSPTQVLPPRDSVMSSPQGPRLVPGGLADEPSPYRRPEGVSREESERAVREAVGRGTHVNPPGPGEGGPGELNPCEGLPPGAPCGPGSPAGSVGESAGVSGQE